MVNPLKKVHDHKLNSIQGYGLKVATGKYTEAETWTGNVLAMENHQFL